jgi:hypothetical protein
MSGVGLLLCGFSSGYHGLEFALELGSLGSGLVSSSEAISAAQRRCIA